MYSPAGFDATLDKWRTQGIYAKIKLLDHLPKKYTCIIFDRRETGQSGGRVERITWAHYVAQGKGLLDHLKIERAHIMGGCMGVPCAAAFGVMHPQTTLSLVLYWPVGGAKYRLSSHQRFAIHLGYLNEHSLADVVALAKSTASPSARTRAAAPGRRYCATTAPSPTPTPNRTSRNTSSSSPAWRARCSTATPRPAPSPRTCMRCDIPALIVPGRDASHATSAARYLEECLPKSEYWDVPVAGQTEDATNARVLDRVRSCLGLAARVGSACRDEWVRSPASVATSTASRRGARRLRARGLEAAGDLQQDPDSIDGYTYFEQLHDGELGPCEHANDTFMPWHRAHLFLFEEALRRSDPPRTENVTVPYWDWSALPSGSRFPKAFENTGSVLFHDFRNDTPICRTAGDGACERLPFPRAYLDAHVLNIASWSTSDATRSRLDSFGGHEGGELDCSSQFGGGFGALEQPGHNTMHDAYVGRRHGGSLGRGARSDLLFVPLLHRPPVGAVAAERSRPTRTSMRACAGCSRTASTSRRTASG